MFSSVTLSDIWLVSPVIVLFLTSLVPITLKVFRGNREQAPFAVLSQAMVGLVLAAFIVIYQWDNIRGLKFGNLLIFDGVSSWTNLITVLIAAVTLFLSYSNPATRGAQFSEYVFLLLNATLGMMVLVWANDLIVIFIAMELMSLCLYVLIALSHEQRNAKEAAFKYFILGSLASAIFLFGSALIFGGAESTSLGKLVEAGPALMASNRIFLFGMLLLLSGLAFKVSLFPFHAWTPDVYQGAPTPISAFMATGVKLIMFVVFLRIAISRELLQVSSLLNVFQWMAVLTMFLGNLVAIRQENLKRMLAYSSIAHSGYILIGIITVAMSSSGVAGATSVLFYLLSYTVMNLGAFGVISIFEKNENTSLLMDDLTGASKKWPWLAACLTLFLLSLAGIPPTVGFFGKFYLFTAALNEGLNWLVVWGVVNSVISVYYYLRPIVKLYMEEPDSGTMDATKDFLGRVAVFGAAILVVAIGVSSGPFFDMIRASVETLFN